MKVVAITGIMDSSGVVCSDLLREGEQQNPSPNGAKSSPSYAEITKNKSVDSSGFSDEDLTEQFSKYVGRKSGKEAREEEAERLNMQGIQSTIEMSLGRTKRTRPLKGVIIPSLPSK